MNVKDLLNGLNYEIIKGSDEAEINKIEFDSRKISDNDMFICIEGFNTDGHNYIDMAVKNGAKVIVCSKEVSSTEAEIIIKVTNGRKALAVCSANFYDNPAKKLRIIGVTGTNGKTTTVFMLKAILEEAGYKVGLIGTIANYIGSKKIETSRTTPESLELHKLFREMVDVGVTYCVMEVSSHSLFLDRVYGIQFCEGIFTNLTQDHLDFHNTFENYFNAKLILFKNSEKVIVNIDDIYGKRIINEVNKQYITYSIENASSIKAENIKMHSKGVEFDIKINDKQYSFNLSLPGRYNIYNALGAVSACINEKIAIDVIKKSLQNVFVPGRSETITKNINLGFEVILDYAHTPDGLENILKTAREFTKGRLISVFGCGGDRDKTKRPKMGKLGTDLSDIAIITSDNPRTEKPDRIIEDITSGIDKDNFIVIEDRKKALKEALKIARQDDIIVVAGKGHENYQEINGAKLHFDEKEIIFKLINELFQNVDYK